MRARLGLISASPLNHSFLSRAPGVADQLGPVMAPSRRLAARLVRSIGAGHPVESYRAFQPIRTILVCAPDALVSKLVAEVVAAELDWNGKIVLLCGSTLESSELEELASLGAATGSVMAVDGIDKLDFVVEGQREAIREVRSLVPNARVQEIPGSRKVFYLAGVSFSTKLFTPLLEASVRCLREAGFKPGAAAALAEQFFQRTLRAYLHGGRNARGSRLPGEDQSSVQRQIDALRRTNPVLARYFCRNVASALEVMGVGR